MKYPVISISITHPGEDIRRIQTLDLSVDKARGLELYLLTQLFNRALTVVNPNWRDSVVGITPSNRDLNDALQAAAEEKEEKVDDPPN